MTRVSVIMAGLGLLAALAVDAFYLLVEVYRSSSCTVSSTGVADCRESSSTLISENGNAVLLALAFPTILAAAVLLLMLPGLHLSRFFSWLAVALLMGFCLVTGFSIGLPYFIVAGFCLLAVLLDKPSPSQATA
jgi:hypothetical protein